MWKVQQINTGTGEATLVSEHGDKIDVVIPHEHRHDPHLSREHLHAACRAHEATKKPAVHFKEHEQTPERAPDFRLFWTLILAVGALLIALSFEVTR